MPSERPITPADCPDVPYQDEYGTDLMQLEYNCSLTIQQRMDQYFQWLAFVEAARDAGRRLYGMDPRIAEEAD
jgi:hypothetical protein